MESLDLPECLSGSGASGSTFASWTRFVTGLAAVAGALSTDFFGPAESALARGFEAGDLAAARPGLSADLDGAGFAAVTGLSVDLSAAGRDMAGTASAGTSRVSVFKLA